MKNLLATVAVAFAPLLTPALAADGAGNASDEEKDPTMKELAGAIAEIAATLGKANDSETGCTATSPCGLWGRLDNLTTAVGSLAGRGHQVAVVETVPRSIQNTGPNGSRLAAHVDYYLVGHSTIPGFPAAGTVGPTGRFASYSVALPAGTYLFELQQPYSTDLKCHGNVSRLNGVDGGTGRGGCPYLSIVLTDGTATGASATKRFDDGFGIYTVTSSSGLMRLKHRFPSSVTFTGGRAITSYKGAVKITKLK